MTLQELLEHAQLDALGLLDPEDQEPFEVAFRAAPTQVQAQIRREQQRLCVVDPLLPDVPLPGGLWPKVQEAVAKARLEALAGVAFAEDAVGHDAQERIARALPMSRAKLVHRSWRASTIGFATAAVVLGAVLLNVTLTHRQQMTSLERDAKSLAIAETFGRPYLSGQLFDKSTARSFFSPVAAESPCKAAIFSNASWDKSVLYTQAVASKPGQNIRVVVLDDKGNVLKELDSFESTGGLVQRELDLRGVEITRIALVSAPKDAPATQGTVIMRMA